MPTEMFDELRVYRCQRTAKPDESTIRKKKSENPFARKLPFGGADLIKYYFRITI